MSLWTESTHWDWSWNEGVISGDDEFLGWYVLFSKMELYVEAYPNHLRWTFGCTAQGEPNRVYPPAQMTFYPLHSWWEFV